MAGAVGPVCLVVKIRTPATRPTTNDTTIAAPTAMTREVCPIRERPVEVVILAIALLAVAVVVLLAVEIVALVLVVVSVLLVSDMLTVLVPVVVRASKHSTRVVLQSQLH